MLSHFLRPARREFALAAPAILVVGAGARFFAGDGSTWNTLALLATTGLFALLAAQWPALSQLDVTPRRWLGDAVGTVAA